MRDTIKYLIVIVVAILICTGILESIVCKMLERLGV